MRDDAAKLQRRLSSHSAVPPKESKQFGAQRQDSRKRRVWRVRSSIFLAVQAFADPCNSRGAWKALQVESAANYLEGIDIEGYSCIISLKDDLQ